MQFLGPLGMNFDAGSQEEFTFIQIGSGHTVISKDESLVWYVFCMYHFTLPYLQGV